MVAKYGGVSEWEYKEVKDGYKEGNWKAIVKGLP